MIQEDKDLLLKDLCARLPYGVKVEAKGLLKTIADDYDNRDIINVHVLNGLNLRDYFKTYSIDSIEKVPLFNRKGVCNIKPYLYPFSSMTKKQIDFIHTNPDGIYIQLFDNTLISASIDGFNWLNTHHFDYRGLIEKGLAIDATNLNIY